MASFKQRNPDTTPTERKWNNTQRGLTNQLARQQTLLQGAIREDRRSAQGGKARSMVGNDFEPASFYRQAINEISRRLLWWERGVVTKGELDAWDANRGLENTKPGWKAKKDYKPWQEKIAKEVADEYAKERMEKSAALAEKQKIERGRRASLLGQLEDE
jgi:hypothetical protein